MKIFCSFLLLLSVSQVVALGRMPSEVHHLKSVGNKLVKIFVTEDTDSEYHIVKTNDIKRLVGSGKEEGCYMYYHTGAELIKLYLKAQRCEVVLRELLKSAQGKDN